MAFNTLFPVDSNASAHGDSTFLPINFMLCAASSTHVYK